MRSILGLAFLVVASLGGIEYATKLMPSSAPTGAPLQVQATLLAPPPETFGGIVQTVAATQPAPVVTQPAQTPPAPLPPVTVAPLAPRAEPINPIVEPIKRPPPVAKTATKTANKSAPVIKSAPVKAAAAKANAVKIKAAKVNVARVNAAKPKSAPASKHATAKAPKIVTAPEAPIVTVTRPGFKLTCTVAQRLDPAKQRCVPLKRQH